MGTKSKKKKKCQAAPGQPLTGHMIEENASYRVPETHPRRSTQSECAGCGATITFTIQDEEHQMLSPVESNKFTHRCDNCESVHEFTVDFTSPLALSDVKSILGLYHTRGLEFAPDPWSSRGSDLSKDLVVRFANASTGDSVDLLLQFMFAMPELLWMKDMCENLPLHGLCSNQLLDQDTKTHAACVMGR